MNKQPSSLAEIKATIPANPHGGASSRLDGEYEIPIAEILSNPLQPRTLFDKASLQELAGSIKTHGVIQPLIITPNESSAAKKAPYILIAGERRLRAARLAGLTTVPCVFRSVALDDQQRLEIALIENVQRADLTVAEEARAYQQFHDGFGLTDEQIAQRVGKARPTITATRNLAKLPPAVVDRIGDGAGQLPKRTVRQLLPLATAVPPEKLIAIADEIIALDPDENRDADDVIFQTLENVAHRLPRKGEGWALDWPAKPIELPSPFPYPQSGGTAGREGEGQGVRVIPACKGCPFMVTAKSGWRGGDYCVNVACFEVKTELFAEKEIARISKKLSIPVADSDETIYVVDLDYRTDGQARKWLTIPPAHLRLVAKTDDDRANYHHKEILGSPAILLASTLKEPFKSKSEPALTTDGRPETDAQRQKRLAAEEKDDQLRRDERASNRKARADVGWLGLHVAKLVAPQIAATGSTLEFLAAFVGDRKKNRGPWTAVNDALFQNSNALKIAQGKEREALLRERILLHLLDESVPTYFNDWERDWTRAVREIKTLVTSVFSKSNIGLGLKLPAGWDMPPVHQTESNCHVCGKFAPGETLTKRDMEEFGWQRAKGVVTCSDDCRKQSKPLKHPERSAVKSKDAGKAKSTQKKKART